MKEWLHPWRNELSPRVWSLVCDNAVDPTDRGGVQGFNYQCARDHPLPEHDADPTILGHHGQVTPPQIGHSSMPSDQEASIDLGTMELQMSSSYE